MLRSCGPLTALLLASLACSHSSTKQDAGSLPGSDAGFHPRPDGGIDAGPFDAGYFSLPDGGFMAFCTLPGSVVFADGGRYTVPGAIDAGQPDFSWLTLPQGFCVHHYAVVPDVRQIRFAPGGELFAMSPNQFTVSGGQGGLGEIVVVPDDNFDGFGDELLTFESGLTSSQGILFANNSLYYQDETQIISEPYVKGQRVDNGIHTLVADITVYTSDVHWAKTLDISDTGQIFVGNGGDEGDTCLQPMPFHGGILQLDGTPGGKQIAMGFRNPIQVKCHRDGHDHCFAAELSEDGSGLEGGREKLVPINAGDNRGFPCCATTNLPYQGISVACPGNPSMQCLPDCSAVTQDTNSFLIGETPFAFDFVDTQFPSPWNFVVIVGLHGAYESWLGARLVAIDVDPTTGLPLPSSTMDGGADQGAMNDFATGWDDGTRAHGRPTDVTLSPDGRLFIADDQLGEIFWIAPIVPPS